MKNILLSLGILLFLSTKALSITFDFEGGAGVAPYTETESGVTMSVSASGGLNVADLGNFGGTVGNAAVTSSAGTATITFDKAVDVSSLLIANTNASAKTIQITPDTGSAVLSNSLSQNASQVINPNFTNITSMTLTFTSGTFEGFWDNIVVTEVTNNTPTISIDDTTINFTENGTQLLIDSLGTVSDADGDTEWNGGTLSVQITANNEAADEISISDTDGDATAITISGTNILSNGTDIGDLSSSGGVVTSGTKLTITFDSDATNANVQEVLQSVRYRNTSENPGTSNRTVTFTATDINAASATDTRTITITAVDDGPTINKNTGLTLNEGATKSITTTELKVDDVDSSATILTYTITTAPSNGQLENTDNTGVAITSFTQQNLLDGKIQYVHNGSNTTSDSFIFKVSDSAPNELTNQTFSITVIAVDDDTPTIVNKLNLLLNEGDTYSITTTELNATDTDTSDATLTYTITTAPSNGQVENTDNSGVAITSFTQQNLLDGKIRYLHDGSNTTSDSLIFKVSDGSSNELTNQTLNITINAIDDDTATISTNNGLTLNEGATKSIPITELEANDTDTDNATLTYTITTAPSNGELENTDSPGTPITSFTQQNLVDGKIQYVHDGSNTTSDYFVFKVADGTPNELTGQTFAITIINLNDAPELNSIPNPSNKDEDFLDFNITLGATDTENDTYTFDAKSNDTTKATVIVNGNQLMISSVANAYGVVSVDVNVTQDSNSTLYDMQTILFTINPINDAPAITTAIVDFNITEDSGTYNFDINISDVEETNLSVTVESNNTSILTAVANWSGDIVQANYENYLDFNLTTQQDANGIVRITLNVDDGDKNATRSFDVNVTALNDLPTSSDLNITMAEDTSKTFAVNDFNFTDVDIGDMLDSIYITSLESNGTLTYNGIDVTLNQHIADITKLKFTPDANAFASPYATFDFIINDGDANSTASYTATINVTDVAETVTPTPTPTPEPTQTPEDNSQLLFSEAGDLDTGVILGESQEGDESIILTFTDEDGTPSQVEIPKVQDRTINTLYNDGAIEFTLDGEQAVASYNNNGTTEHSMLVDNKETIAISYIPGATVEFTYDGGVQSSISLDTSDGKKSDVVLLATPSGHSLNSVTPEGAEPTSADSSIPGTQTVLGADGKVVVDTPVVVSSLGNEITTQTTLDTDGNAVVSAVRTLPDGTVEQVPLGSYTQGSEVTIQELDGAVVVEVITSIGTERFTLRSGRR